MTVLSAELSEFADTIRSRADARIGSYVDCLDRQQRFSPQVWRELADMEMFSLCVPVEVGGLGGSFLAFAVATEAIARTSAAAALYPGTTVQVATLILHHGTPEQIERWLPALVRGDSPAAWAFTEPQTGSDPRQLTTAARREGDGWRLHGQKLFISYARQAALALVFARTPAGGVGAFVVHTDQEGWSTGEPFELLALGGGEPAPIFLDDVFVPDTDVLGDPESGFEVMLSASGRFNVTVRTGPSASTKRVSPVGSPFNAHAAPASFGSAL